MEVTQFTAQARAEFAKGKQFADGKPFPAEHELFTSRMGSTVKVETHTYMSNLPRLSEFVDYTPFVRLTNKEYTVTNKEYRTGIAVKKTDIDDGQTDGYMQSVNGLTARARKDVGLLTLDHLAAGTTNLCFDSTAFFADSHTVGSGDNLDTFNAASNDGVTHKIIALICDNPNVKPILYQDREALSELKTDTGTPQADLVKDYQYWVDTRFGLGYGYWWDGYHITITDTPTIEELYTIFEQIVNGFRTFTLPKGRNADGALYIHEGWRPAKENFVLLCNLKLGARLERALSISQYVTSTGNVDNVYKDKATVIPTSALGA